MYIRFSASSQLFTMKMEGRPKTEATDFLTFTLILFGFYI